MSVQLDRLLTLIEEDMAASAGEQFVQVAARYFEESREPHRSVSTGLSPDDLADRFTAPLQAGGQAPE